MLIKKDLEKQETFSEWTDGKGCYYDGYFDYCLSPNSVGGYSFCLHSEVDGSMEEVCRLDNLEHLKEIYEVLSDLEFE